jgi:VanZ family protein
MAVIFVLSGIPNITRLPGDVSDLAAHFAGYGLLGALVVRAMAGVRWAGVTPAAAGRAWLFSAAYGVSDEFHQSFVPGRTPSGIDWVADAAGAAVAIAAIVLVSRVVRRATTSAKGYGGPP